jgi:transposase-like protein
MAKEDPTDKLLDELLAGKNPEEILGKDGLLDDLTRRLVNRALEGEMTHHLG